MESVLFTLSISRSNFMFITLEGPDGSGKSSQVPELAEYFQQAGYRVLTTREPGGTPIGDQVRAILSSLGNTAMQPRTETLLFLAARAQLVEDVIRPHLESGGVVISDRFADSTLAYQGYGHGVDRKLLEILIGFATCELKPDLTILMDIDVEEGLRRRASGGEWNRLDSYEVAFHKRVRHGYLEMAKAEPARWVIIDAGQPPETVQNALRHVILKRLQARPNP